MIPSDPGIAVWIVILAIAVLLQRKWKLGISLSAFAISAATGPSVVLGRGEVGLAGFVSAFAAIRRLVEIRLEDVIIAYWFIRWALDAALRANVRLDRKTLLNIFPLYVISMFIGALVFVFKTGGESFLPWLYFVKYLQYFLVFVYVANHVRDEEKAKGLLRLTLLLGMPVGLWAVFQIIAGTHYSADGSARAVLPFHDGPGPLAEYTLILIPLALYAGYIGKLVSKKTAFSLTVLLSAALLGASSRLAMAGLLIALSLASLVFARRVLFVGLASLGALVGSAFAFPELVPEWLVLRATDLSTWYGDPQSSASLRLNIWDMALHTWRNDPILGIGLTGFPVADNQYVRTLVELGVVGLLIFLLTLVQFVLVGKNVFDRGRAAGSKLFESIGVSYLCTLFAIFIYAVSLDAFQPIRDMNVFWYYTGIMFAISQMLRRKSPALRKAPRRALYSGPRILDQAIS